MENYRKEMLAPESTLARTEVKSKKLKLKILAAIFVLGAVIISIVLFSVVKRSKENVDAIFYALPELPDMIGFYSEEKPNEQLIDTNNRLFEASMVGTQIGENGTIATQLKEGGDVEIYQNGIKNTIPSPVEYFYLSNNGRKIVYGASKEETFIWDVLSEKSKLISDETGARGISHDGNILYLNDTNNYGEFYSKGRNLSWRVPGIIIGTSAGGKYNYCLGRNAFYLDISGAKGRIMDWPEDYSGAYIIAHSSDYTEILFRVKEDVYYYSVKNYPQEAEYVKGSGNGYLFSLEDMAAGISLDDWMDFWLPHQVGAVNSRNRSSHSILNNLYCLVKEEGETRSVSIVMLNSNKELVELIPDLVSNVCLSQDGKKMWCIAGGKAVFYDMAAKNPEVQYCTESYARMYYSTYDNMDYRIDYGVYDDNVRGFVSIAMTADGSKMCFVGEDGKLWMCTPDTVDDPEPLMENALWVWCSSNDEFYVLTGENLNESGDLYMINSEGDAIYQYSNVEDVYMTKSNVYLLTEKENSSDHELYYKDNGKYRLLNSDVSSMKKFYWGKKGY